jgi:hypothetical protein
MQLVLLYNKKGKNSWTKPWNDCAEDELGLGEIMTGL